MKKRTEVSCTMRTRQRALSNEQANWFGRARITPDLTLVASAARLSGIALGIAVARQPPYRLLIAPSRAEMDTTVMGMQLDSPPFANPSEVRTAPVKGGCGGSCDFLPSRKFAYRTSAPDRGGGGAAPGPPPGPSPLPVPISPGPTLRARLGDMVEISFLNKIDDTQFPYTFVTDSTPGQSDFGCDKAGTRDPHTGISLPIPATTNSPTAFTAPAPPTFTSMALIPVRMGWAITCSCRCCPR